VHPRPALDVNEAKTSLVSSMGSHSPEGHDRRLSLCQHGATVAQPHGHPRGAGGRLVGTWWTRTYRSRAYHSGLAHGEAGTSRHSAMMTFRIRPGTTDKEIRYASTATTTPGLAAQLWVKAPGESDGICGGENSYLPGGRVLALTPSG